MAAVIISTIAVIGAVGAVIVKFDKEGPEMINEFKKDKDPEQK